LYSISIVLYVCKYSVYDTIVEHVGLNANTVNWRKPWINWDWYSAV